MKTLGDVLKLSAKYLEDHGIKRAARDAEDLLAFVLNLKRLDLYMQFDRPLESKELDLYRPLLKRKAAKEPLEYILGQVEFYHCKIRVTPDVLIPRQETEILLDKVCKMVGNEKVAWDLCCGSGCLGLGLKKAMPQLDVTLADMSDKALLVAQENASLNNLDVKFMQGDLLEPFKRQKADLIVCNPPYVSEEEYGQLDVEVKSEPKMALVASNGGYAFYEKLALQLPEHLNSGGKAFFEIGATQGEKVKTLFSKDCFKRKWVEKDWAGHDRFFFLEME